MLLPIQGKTVLEHLIARMQAAKLSDMLVLCTTIESRDDQLEQLSVSAGISVFRGSEEDVPGRFLGAVDEFGIDFFLIAEGDEVFADPECADQIFRRYQDSGADFIALEGLPIGAYLIGIKADALREVCRRKAPGNTDGWSRYFTQTGWFRVESLSVDEPLRRPNLRFTLDYPEDFAVIQAVYDRLYHPAGEEPSLHEILALMDANPDLVAINRNRVEEYEQHTNEYPALRFTE
jgi:spore coat polysaccharide biosynthesis protein SpsF